MDEQMRHPLEPVSQISSAYVAAYGEVCKKLSKAITDLAETIDGFTGDSRPHHKHFIDTQRAYIAHEARDAKFDYFDSLAGLTHMEKVFGALADHFKGMAPGLMETPRGIDSEALARLQKVSDTEDRIGVTRSRIATFKEDYAAAIADASLDPRHQRNVKILKNVDDDFYLAVTGQYQAQFRTVSGKRIETQQSRILRPIAVQARQRMLPELAAGLMPS